MKRSKIEQLPPELKEWLDAELIRRGFGDYRRLAIDLIEQNKERGESTEMSKSAVHRYGKKLQRRMDAIKASTEAATLIEKNFPDDADARAGATISLVMTDTFNTIVDLQEAEDAINPVQKMKLLSAVAKNIATLSRASVHQKRHKIEIRGKATAAAERAARIGKKGGLSAGAVDEIRREILGIAT